MQTLIEQLQTYWKPQVERCGYVDLDNNIIEVDNIHENPKEGFELATLPAEAIALWHTHPSGCPNLSVADYHLFASLPKLIHAIIGQAEVVLYFVDTDGAVLRGE